MLVHMNKVGCSSLVFVSQITYSLKPISTSDCNSLLILSNYFVVGFVSAQKNSHTHAHTQKSSNSTNTSTYIRAFICESNMYGAEICLRK